MTSTVDEAQRIGCKIFFDGTSAPDINLFIPVFHRWIQTSAVDGLLIDVADYAHVEQGPGILLVAHEGIYSADNRGGRLGMQFSRRQPQDGDLSERLRSVCRMAVRAAHLLEGETELGGSVRCAGNEMQLFANDRLLAPNCEETMQAFRPAVDALLAAAYPGAECEVVREGGEGETFAARVKAPQPVDLATLLSRLGS